MTKAIVYIVDDDEAVRDSIKELVKSVGMRAKVFESALAVLEVLTTESAGCIVLDVRMTGMSGLGLQKRLGELNIELPLIFITGHGDIDMAVQAIKEGAMDFIQKPYHEQNLLDSINAAMDENKEKILHNFYPYLLRYIRGERKSYYPLLRLLLPMSLQYYLQYMDLG